MGLKDSISTVACAILAFILSTFTSAAQVIEGTVVDTVSGAPIAEASIQISNAGAPSYGATSDAHGAFRMDGVPDGNYTALAFKDGFLTVQDENTRRPFRVVAGLDPVRLTLALTPRGHLAGRVFDSENRAVSGAQVRLLSRQSSGSGQTVTTGPEGEFSFDMAPGSYFLSARPPAKLAPPARVGDQEYAWAQTWYPGVSQPGEAQKILIRPGAQLVDQDLKLGAVNAYTIRGQVRDSNGDPVADVLLKLIRGDEGAQGMERTTLAGPDRAFEFRGVYDGDWRLSAERGGEVMERAFARVAITAHDSDIGELRLSAPFRVPVEFFLATDDAFTKIQGDAVLDPDGGGPAPVLSRVYPGQYLVKPLTPQGYYVASVLLGDQDILGRITQFSANSPPLKVVYRSDGGTLRGNVDNCGAARVALVLADPVLRQVDPFSVRFTPCTASAQFELRGLRPGRYYVFAFDASMNAAEIDRASLLDALPDLINKATTVDVQAKQIANIDLKVLSAF